MATLIPATKTFLPLLGVALAAALLFNGCSHRKMCGSRHDWTDNPEKIEAKATKKVDKVLDELEATQDQRTRVHAVKTRLLDQFMAMAQDKGAMRDQVRVAWASEQFDSASLHVALDENADSMREFGHEVVESIAEIHEILTPEQRDQAVRKFDKHCKKR